jgi:hypothetical protein
MSNRHWQDILENNPMIHDFISKWIAWPALRLKQRSRPSRRVAADSQNFSER